MTKYGKYRRKHRKEHPRIADRKKMKQTEKENSNEKMTPKQSQRTREGLGSVATDAYKTAQLGHHRTYKPPTSTPEKKK